MFIKKNLKKNKSCNVKVPMSINKVPKEIKYDVDHLEGLVNYLTIQLFEAGGKPLKPNEPVPKETLEAALETINKELKKTRGDSSITIKSIPDE